MPHISFRNVLRANRRWEEANEKIMLPVGWEIKDFWRNVLEIPFARAPGVRLVRMVRTNAHQGIGDPFGGFDRLSQHALDFLRAKHDPEKVDAGDCAARRSGSRILACTLEGLPSADVGCMGLSPNTKL